MDYRLTAIQEVAGLNPVKHRNLLEANISSYRHRLINLGKLNNQGFLEIKPMSVPPLGPIELIVRSQS